ncbi:hypothetical protein [Stenotrophomonas maltophilia]|uniref:hypothetical protein n=1 Tax=Stenotrophomonas maltophilia TaxID=40324 RepID=UPI0013869EC7
MRPSAISNYRKGVSHPDAVACATLAGLTGVSLARVLGVIGEAPWRLRCRIEGFRKAGFRSG